jgi:hypothetical protein
MDLSVNEDLGKLIFYQLFSCEEGLPGGCPGAGFSRLWITGAALFCITMGGFSAAFSGGFRW